MSENSPKEDNKQSELTELLDDALKDFEDPGETPEAIEEVSKIPPLNAGDAFLKESIEETMKSFMNVGEAELAAGLQEFMSGDESNMQAIIQETLKNLVDSKENLPEGSDLTSMFANLDMQDNAQINLEDDMLPMLMQFMQPLLSKDILYPSIKDLCDKYPKWLEDNEATSDKEEYERNIKMFSCIKEVRDHLDTQQDIDDEVTKTRKFKELMELLKKMQECGQPPKELLDLENAVPTPDMGQCNLM